MSGPDMEAIDFYVRAVKVGAKGAAKLLAAHVPDLLAERAEIIRIHRGGMLYDTDEKTGTNVCMECSPPGIWARYPCKTLRAMGIEDPQSQGVGNDSGSAS